MKVFNVSKGDRLFIGSTSKGNQVKWCVHGENDLLYLKADKYGYEGISEALVSEFLGFIGGISYVDYSLCRIIEGGEFYYGCYSENMLGENEVLVPVQRVCRMAGYNMNIYDRLSPKDKVSFVVDAVKDVCGINIFGYLGRIIYLDSIIFNEVRLSAILRV